ncbi:cob(I)yrinic acid a,c-diamide adenosyltransferase [Balneolales bacterium ANBcel1]|nr:cob(I)yrinic acid a,c-diamide adenosyltransferase [Balneolales bacterium ANBcel1]
MKIYTRTGDQGSTSLFGGERVPKNHIRIDAYGTVDELNCMLGLTLAADPDPDIRSILERLQHELFVLGADLATPPEKNSRIERITEADYHRLEQDIDRLEQSLSPLKTFILPGGSSGAAGLHMARTICRRAERIVYTCRKDHDISDESLIYLNRLSDLLFVMSRYENHRKGRKDIPWDKTRRD